jgi:DNA-binding response OmpR family regulator
MPDDGRLGSVARRLAATDRVLSVEDEHDIADFLRAYFRASGYDLIHVDPDTALEVLHAIDEHRPDCVLLDLGLRGFNGAEAYRLLRTEDRYAYLPVIVVSARPDAGDVVHASGSALDAVVVKPFNVNTLAGIVGERIARARELRDRGQDQRLGIPTAEYVEARLESELALAGEERLPVAFGLVRLRSLPDIIATVGGDGTGYVVRELLRQTRELLPREAVLGMSRDDELALLLPGCTATEAGRMLGDALDDLGVTASLPGGAEVPVRLAAGLAGFPEHADDADGLYMAADAALADACDRDERITLAV